MNPSRLSSRQCFRLLILGVVWAVVFTPLSYFATVQPRLTIALGDVSIIGITPDSHELVACASHNRPSALYSNSIETAISGPLSLWNLRTGSRRVIPLPGELALPLWENTSRTPLRIGTSDLVSPDIRGRWLQLGRNVENRGAGSDPAYDANLLVNLDTGAIRQTSERDGYSTGMALSSTGRWYIEVQSEEKQWDGEPDRIRLIETATGSEQFAFESSSGLSHHVFSADDRSFASVQHMSPYRNEEGLLRVWNIATRELRFSAKGAASIPVFSDDGKHLAVLIRQNDHSQLAIYNVVEQRLSSEFDARDRGAPSFISDSTWMRFSKDGESILVADGAPLSLIEAGSANPIRLNLEFACHLQTGIRTDFREEYWDPRVKPCSEGNFDLPPFSLKMMPDGPDVICDLATGEVCGQLPFAADPITVSQDGRTIILRPWEEFEPSPLQRLVEYLDGKGMPIPQWVWDSLEPSGRVNWQIVDVASGGVTASMPDQSFEHWISPDGKTMLTKTAWDSREIRVWDFPPHKSFWSAALWALVAPAVIGLWWWMRRKPSTALNVAA